MRGKGIAFPAAMRCRGITPAYAGKSVSDGWRSRKIEDHPRLCGEKLSVMRSVADRTGSPPPMRGKEMSGMSDVSANGITPAYAGKSLLEHRQQSEK